MCTRPGCGPTNVRPAATVSRRRTLGASDEAATSKAPLDQAEERQAEAIARAAEASSLVVPPVPRWLVDDATPEALAGLLATYGRIALLSPEGDVFDQMAGRYNQTAGPSLGVYLKGHAGDLLKVDSQNAGALRLGVALRAFIVYRRLTVNVQRDQAELYASWFRCLADPTRIQILNLLARERRPLSVGEIVALVDVGQSTVSEHLRRLAETCFVHVEHRGTSSYFQINEACIDCFPSAAEFVMGRVREDSLPRARPGVTSRRAQRQTARIGRSRAEKGSHT